MQGRYSHARQMNRSKREQKKLRIYLGRVIRDIRRKCSKPDEKLSIMLDRAQRIFAQNRSDKNKLYSMQAPEVECIAKGKVHKKYEFGCKASEWKWYRSRSGIEPIIGHAKSDHRTQLSQGRRRR